jgi:hypothetical protein
MFRLLPESRFKLNFSRAGLRVELLLIATSAEVNTRHLEVLRRRLARLQDAVGPAARLEVESLPGRTQARVAAYLRGGVIEDRSRWTEYEDWFIDVLGRFEAAIHAAPDIYADW